MRPLVIGPEDKEVANRLMEFASKPENLYRVGETRTTPGDDPRYVIKLFQGFRAVFTHTLLADGRLYRHLSISVDKKNKLPHPAAVVAIAHLLGLEGGLKDWQVEPNRLESCITVVQQITH